jgi:hypothetical protein
VAAEERNELSAALDELYAAEPDDFVTARTRLAADRRAAGDTAGAKVLQAARKPTVAAWALNQLRRRTPERLEAFLDRSRELRAADRDSMRGALAGQRQAFNDVTDAALAVLGSRANDGYRARITATLHAATADESVADALGLGRLTHEVTEPGFPPGDLAPAALRRPRRSRPAPAKPAPRPDDADARAETRAEETRAEQRAAAAERERRRADADVARRDAEVAADAADEAARLVERRKAELDDARRAQREAADRARRTRREAERLAAARDRLP